MNLVCEAAYERKAEDIVVMEMKDRSSLCDYFVIMSAPSTVRVKAIVEYIEVSLKKDDYRLKHKEGHREGFWVLMDYGPVIVHVFYYDMRKFYDLENLWGDAPKRPFVK